jgi:protein SCO1/2
VVSGGDASPVWIDEHLGAKVPGDARLLDESGKEIAFADLLGKPVVLTLNYYRCAGICTPLLNGVVDVLNAVAKEPGRDFRVVTVSFDDRDTPEIAFQKRRNYVSQMRRAFPVEAWRFLTGKAAETGRIARAVGFGFRRQGEDFLHPGAIMVLTPEGAVSRYMYGTTFLPADLEMAIDEAAHGESRPTIAKVLPFCFRTDPTGRGVVVDVTRVAGLATIALMGGGVAFLALRRRSGKEAR